MIGLIVGIIVWLIAIWLFAVIVEIAWNHVMPHVFHLKCIDTWQALALVFLSVVLLGGGFRTCKNVCKSASSSASAAAASSGKKKAMIASSTSSEKMTSKGKEKVKEEVVETSTDDE